MANQLVTDAGKDQSAPAPVILLVEADDALQRIVSSYLLHDGYTVIRFTTLEEAVDAMRRGMQGVRPDLLLLDLDSLNDREIAGLAPPEPGRVTAEEDGDPAPPAIERISLPVLLLAGNADQSCWARRYGAEVLHKPFAIPELRREVRGALARAEASR